MPRRTSNWIFFISRHPWDERTTLYGDNKPCYVTLVQLHYYSVNLQSQYTNRRKKTYNAEIQQIPMLKLVPNCVGTGPKGWWKSNSRSTAAEKELQLTSSKEPSREKSSDSRATSASLLRLLLIFECFSSRESQRLNSLSTFGSGRVRAFFVLKCSFSCILF